MLLHHYGRETKGSKRHEQFVTTRFNRQIPTLGCSCIVEPMRRKNHSVDSKARKGKTRKQNVLSHYKEWPTNPVDTCYQPANRVNMHYQQSRVNP